MQQETLFFKRWSKKGYASFVSMRRIVRIGVLSMGCSLLTLPGASTFAATDRTTDRSVNLKDVEVIAPKIERQDAMTRTVTVINNDITNAMPLATIDDMLRYASGIDLRQRGGEGVQSDISIRGGGIDQTQILLNGINISDPQTGHYNLDIPVSLSDVDRIEILEGPDSRSLGSNAFAGAINIVTGNSNSNKAKLSYRLGDHGLHQSQASASLVTGKTTLLGSVNYNRCDGYTTNTDFDIFNAFLQCRLQHKWSGNMNIQAGFQTKGFGAQSFYSLAYPNQYEKTTTILSSVSTTYKLEHFTLSPQVYWRGHLDRFDLFRDISSAPTWYQQANYHQTNVIGGDIKGCHYEPFGKTSLGISFRSEHIYSTVIGDKMDSLQVWFDKSEHAYFDKEKRRTLFGAFIDQGFQTKHWTTNIGGKWNYSNDFGHFFTGGGDIGWSPFRAIHFFTSVNQALRLPTFTELYYSSKDHLPNNNLQPERSLTFEAGIKYNHHFSNSTLQARATAFYRKGHDIIDWVKNPNETVWKSLNHTQIDAIGCNTWINWKGSLGLLREILLSYDLTHLDKDADGYQSQYALDYLKQKIVLTIKHNIYEQSHWGAIGACWTATLSDREGLFTTTDGTAQSYSPFALLNVRLSWHKDFDKNLQAITIFIDVDNLTNNHYYDYGGIRQAGLWAKGGFNIIF